MSTENSTPLGSSAVLTTSKHMDRIEKLDAVFYIRWTSGPDYEDAFICVDDDEPDMNAIAKVPFAKARLFAEAYRFVLSRAAIKQD